MCSPFPKRPCPSTCNTLLSFQSYGKFVAITILEIAVEVLAYQDVTFFQKKDWGR